MSATNCLDFINTDLVLNGEPIDLLSSFQELVTGLVQAGLLAEEEANNTEREGTRQGAESLKQAKAFRTIMRETVERLAARRPVPQATLECG